jgi:hypothetical protein
MASSNSGKLKRVAGPKRSNSSALVVTPDSSPGGGIRSTTPTAPSMPERDGSGGGTSKRVSTETPGTTKTRAISSPERFLVAHHRAHPQRLGWNRINRFLTFPCFVKLAMNRIHRATQRQLPKPVSLTGCSARQSKAGSAP